MPPSLAYFIEYGIWPGAPGTLDPTDEHLFVAILRPGQLEFCAFMGYSVVMALLIVCKTLFGTGNMKFLEGVDSSQNVFLQKLGLS